MKQAVLVIYGGGGHQEEANRLIALIKKENPQVKDFVGLCENTVGANPELFEILYVPEFRSKKASALTNIYMMFKCWFCSMIALWRLKRHYDIKLAISTGPGLAIPALFFCRILGMKTIFVESWCRFYSRSFSGAICRFFVHRLYYQNETMKALYPKGEWSGRL